MRIGYGKIGRSWKLDPRNGTSTGGDADVSRALHLLSRMRPDDEFVLVTRNSGEVPQDVGYGPNVTNLWQDDSGLTDRMKWAAKQFGLKSNEFTAFTTDFVAPHLFAGLDAVIMWVGQHGSSNFPIPAVDDRTKLTNPQDSFLQYAGFALIGINAWREHTGKDVVWMCPDPRNYLKLRDLKHPLEFPVLAQYEMTRKIKHERYGDPAEPPQGITWAGEGVWHADQSYEYAAVELTALPHPQRAEMSTEHAARFDFGLLINENRTNVVNARADVLQSWVLPYWPQCEMFGKWSEAGAKAIGRDEIKVAPYEHVPTVLKRWRATLTTPASGSGWATAKPWECFAYGTVCFFHPGYDSQEWILRDAPTELRAFLRVQSPDQLSARVRQLTEDPALWQHMVGMQRAHFEKRYAEELGGVRAVMDRLNLIKEKAA